MKAKKKNPAAVALAKKRSKSMSAARRSEIARNASNARWAKPRPEPTP